MIIFEKNAKVKINLCNTLTILLDNLPNKFFINMLDIEKIEK
jgi:hypothetical protein